MHRAGCRERHTLTPPMLVRGFYYEDWKPASTPVKFKTAQEFYDAVKGNFASDQNVNPMRLTQAVLQGLSQRSTHRGGLGAEFSTHGSP